MDIQLFKTVSISDLIWRIAILSALFVSWVYIVLLKTLLLFYNIGILNF